MPRVKINYIVSFSSEDTENQAQNLLAWDVSKKRWLCDKGEPSCSVVLQLTRAVKINAVHIGAYHAALVEVLVGRSEKPNDPFEVLVPSSVFLSPAESRRSEGGSGAERVRSFGAEQLASGARAQRWDRLRVVCSQPYNKHCKYGLSFVHVYEPEGEGSAPAPAAQPALGLDAPSSDEDEFRPGELFAQHRQKAAGDGGSMSTGAQIRQATSNAIKNLFDPSTKLTKTPIAKTSETHRNKRDSPSADSGANRRKDSLLYTDDDEQPHAKIDHIVNRHKDEKAKKADGEAHRKKEEKLSQRAKEKDDSKRRITDDSGSSKALKDAPKDTPQKRDGSPAGRAKERGRDRKRPHAKDEDGRKGGLRAGPVSSAPHELLRDVVFALSGYEHPRRGAVRDQALAMGARCERDWGPRCTHLVCAFPNTPKLRAVRGARGGDAAVVVTAEWVEQCCARCRRLPWQWFATEPALRQPPPDDDGDETPGSAGGDTDDTDTEEPTPRSKRRRPEDRGADQAPGRTTGARSVSPEQNAAANVSGDSDVTFVRDERVRGHVTVTDSDSERTDADEPDDARCDEVEAASLLPEFFEGLTFALEARVAEQFDADLLRRYVRAYGGLVVEESHLDEDSAVDYWVCAGGGGRAGGAGGVRVRADWIWRCHAARALCPLAGYALT